MQENNPTPGELIRQIFDTYSNDQIQEALGGLLSMSSESREFGDLDGPARSNVVNFVLTLKDHFAKAAVALDKMKGGKDGIN